MLIIHFLALITIAGLCLCYSYLKTDHFKPSKDKLLLVLLFALLIRVLFAYFYHGFDTDISCFAAWANRIYTLGPGAFYDPNVFTDYPPGYMYLLYIIGAVTSWLQIPYLSGLHLVLLKLPAIVCDMVAGVLLYKTAKKRLSESRAILLTAIYVLNPAVLFNSALWGQVDSVFTLAVIAMCIYLTEEKLLPAYICFGIGVLLKPQMLVFTPVLLVGMVKLLLLKDVSLKKLLHNILQGILTILGMVILCAPFGLSKVLTQYASTLGSYPYAAVNAYNFWGFWGLNWTSQDTPFLFLSCKTWGILVIFLIVLFSFFIGLKHKKENPNYFLLGSFIIITMFVFSVRMHERYLFPGLLLLLFAYLYHPIRPLYLSYCVFTVLHYYNTAHVMFFYDPTNYNRKAPMILLVSASMIIAACYFYSAVSGSIGKHKATNGQLLPTASFSPTKRKTSSFAPTVSDSKAPFHKWDFILMLGLTLLYSIFALYDLGNTKAPETTYALQKQESIVLDFGETGVPHSLSYYMGPSERRHYTVETKNELTEDWNYAGEIILETVFTWKDISFKEAFAAQNPDFALSRYVRLTLTSSQSTLLELVFQDASGNVLTPVNADSYPTLFDEVALFPERSSFRDSMYFDEIYHARTAYEYLHGMYSYENTHPPLGKILISLGISLFGMTPFGWRIVGTLLGILMVPITYVFGKQFFRHTSLAALTCVLFTFDFMHFAQTRIATIDVYITFFVILMYYFMYRYTTMSFYDTPFWKTLLPLGLSGVCMGLGIACKWTGAYAGVGLAILFFATLYRRYREYQYACTYPKGTTDGILHSNIIKSFASYTRRTILFCVGAFGCIPALIYTLSYLPFRDTSTEGLITRMLQNQVTMFSYHSELVAEHAYSSHFYQWPTMIRPIWYYSGIVNDTLREGISAFGNPLVWWIGIPAFLYMLYLAIRKKDKYAAFLTIGYLAQYLPWFFVSRLTFIYHYFPSVFFVVLMIVYSILQGKKKLSERSFILLILFYAIAVFLLFLLFYPVLSGQPVEASFVDKWLRWFDSWVLVAR